MAVGIARAGLPGALAAWLGFTLPSALALVLFAFGVDALGGAANAGWLHGLKIVAVPLSRRRYGEWRKVYVRTGSGRRLAIFAAIVTLAWPSAAAQLVSISVAGIIGWWLLPPTGLGAESHTQFRVSKRAGVDRLDDLLSLVVGLTGCCGQSRRKSIARCLR